MNPTALLLPDAFLSPLAIEDAVRRALDEDLGRAGDVTSIATIPETTQAHAVMVARQAGVIAGLPLAVEGFRRLSADIQITPHLRDGETVAAGIDVLTISGPARAILSGERTALNFVGLLSGIATLTADYVRHTSGSKMRICCTRKTTPGLGALEKYAVRCGGGFNHRFGLDDAILIKDNHIAVAGGIRPVLQAARAGPPSVISDVLTVTIAPSRAFAAISISGASLRKVAATNGKPEMVPAWRATTIARARASSGMDAIEVTSPARPRSSASARVTTASISSGERNASGQSRDCDIGVIRRGAAQGPHAAQRPPQ
jgi:nicotinate-nucleotide pyrophosphorylase